MKKNEVKKELDKKRIIKDIIMIIAGIVMLILFVYFGVKDYDTNKTDTLTDSQLFSKEYDSLKDTDNVFQYSTSSEIINILKNQTGVVYLGFPECPWCNYYVKMLNDMAKQNGIEKIYYYNIKEDREENTDQYQMIVNILGDNLADDDEGNKRIYVPDVTFVVKGKIIGHDNESSYDVSDYSSPEEYWTKEQINDLTNKLNPYFKSVYEAMK